MTLEAREFQLSDLLRSVVTVVGETIRAKGISLRIRRTGVPESLRGDTTRLGQALLNWFLAILSG